MDKSVYEVVFGMSESATENYLIDPDKWDLPDDKDVIWCMENELVKIASELGNTMRETLDNLVLSRRIP